jgi:hypothetical protein
LIFTDAAFNRKLLLINVRLPNSVQWPHHTLNWSDRFVQHKFDIM